MHPSTLTICPVLSGCGSGAYPENNVHKGNNNWSTYRHVLEDRRKPENPDEMRRTFIRLFVTSRSGSWWIWNLRYVHTHSQTQSHLRACCTQWMTWWQTWWGELKKGMVIAFRTNAKIYNECTYLYTYLYVLWLKSDASATEEKKIHHLETSETWSMPEQKEQHLE